MKIAFCSSEVFPFAKTGGLGDVCGSLPLALEQLGLDMTVVMPGYRCIAQSGIEIRPLNENVSQADIGNRIKVYFIGHKGYFERQGLYGDGTSDYPDNIDRFSFFCGQTLELFKQIDYQPDIVHCHDWQTALIPVYLKERYGQDTFFDRTRSVLTIHNLAFQGVFPKSQFERIGLEERLLSPKGFEIYDRINLMKAGVLFSDMVTTVSPQYAKEIQTKEFGCGLEKIIHSRSPDVTGILNGLDENTWDPAADTHLTQNYAGADDVEAKQANKAHLQKELGLKTAQDVPVFGFVGRLSHQKGIDLIIESLGELLNEDAQFVFLGMGDKESQNALKRKASQYSGKMAAQFDFNEPLGHRIYAGSDYFMMPSRFEPCGLSQMISLHYGTVPIVYKTGGLVDTIMPYGFWCPKGNGLMFAKYTDEAFTDTVRKAMALYHQPKKFQQMRINAFESRFSWERSAQQYKDIYQCL